MYEALAEFYEEKGYFINSPARSYRYQVLLAFTCEKDPEHEAVYRELLTYDLYLRENIKSRPEFARDLMPYKEAMRDFYRKEEAERRYLPEYRDYDSKQLARMSHLEPFYYPVWEMPVQSRDGESEALIGKGLNPRKEPVFILFDYETRNPLTGDARNFQITPLT